MTSTDFAFLELRIHPTGCSVDFDLDRVTLRNIFFEFSSV